MRICAHKRVRLIAPQTETYVGMTSREFKDRFQGHNTSITKIKYKTETTLSRHVWNLKEEDINFNLTWKIIYRAEPFGPISGVCNLCTLEKYYILFKPGTGTWNKREELFKSPSLSSFFLEGFPKCLENWQIMSGF